MNERPQDMVAAEVERSFGPGMAAEIQPLGNGIFTATIYATDSEDSEIQVTAVALYQIRAVQVGDPVKLSVAVREV